MTAFDAVRLLIFACFGLGVAFMLVTNFVAYQVLRVPKKLGFLWWHVTAISISFLCLGTVAIERVVGALGQPLTWRTFTALVGVVTFAAAQLIIFGVERERLLHQRAAERQAVS